MMNDAFAKDNNENSLHSFLFSQQAKPHAAIDALFSALLPFGQPFTLGIGDEFYLQANDEHYIVLLESGVVSFCHKTNDSIYLHRLRHRSWVWLTAMALPIMSPRDRNTFCSQKRFVPVDLFACRIL